MDCVLALLLTILTSGCDDDVVTLPPPPPPPTSGEVVGALNIAPVVQQTEVWCWAASTEMVLRHYGLPNLNGFGNYQCGVVAAWFGGQCLVDCFSCVSTIGSMSQIRTLIDGYGNFARAIGVGSRVLQSTLVFRALTPTEIALEIGAGRPIVVGINPQGGAPLPNIGQHVAVIVGYDYRDSHQDVLVNDPFPYLSFSYSTQVAPYVRAGGELVRPGQYRISIASLIANLAWANTIYGIH